MLLQMVQLEKRMTGEQIPVPTSPRGREDSSNAAHHPLSSSVVKSGTLMGVFIPCLQNILGIIYYIRFSWIVGMAGIGGSLAVVALCGLCTFLTSISLSAIATNGAMKGGGPYYLIGRALGPEVGVSIGLFLSRECCCWIYVCLGCSGDIFECRAKGWTLSSNHVFNFLVIHCGVPCSC